MATKQRNAFSDMAGDLVRAVAANPVLPHNDQFKVLEYTTPADAECSKVKVQVYILNPGDVFEGFGGSRHGLAVRKTASLIIRTTAVWGQRDVEYNVNDKEAWKAIQEGHSLAAIARSEK